jgi:hypothetical protein
MFLDMHKALFDDLALGVDLYAEQLSIGPYIMLLQGDAMPDHIPLMSPASPTLPQVLTPLQRAG